MRAKILVLGLLAGCPGSKHTGETGETGHTGETGETGETGHTGETAHTGETGETAHTGETGETAHTGETGETGDPGAALDVCELSVDDPYTLDGATLEGDTLFVDVSYGGGCETHTWELCWDGSFAQSYPVQVWVELGHDDHDDPCDAWISETLSFDLSPLAEAYEDAYHTAHDTVTVHFEGSTMSYTF